jgi:nitronate monooxygenase/enoyl-[acyl-carrier protein] reductase II
MALVPQVVDAVAPVPVLAAGGIADGRGLAAALVLGAAGVNIGTRFVATVEADVSERYKARIVAAASQDATRIGTGPFPPPAAGTYSTAPRGFRRDRPRVARRA